MFDFTDPNTAEFKNYHRYVDTQSDAPYSSQYLINNLDFFEYNYIPNINNLNFNATEVSNVISESECKLIISEVLQQNKWIELPDDPFWSGRNTGLFTLVNTGNPNRELALLVIKIHNTLRSIVSENFANGQTVFCDQIGVVRWPVGSWQMTHIDQVDGMDRVCGSVLYLNDGYDGGHTFYPYFDKYMTPKTGKFFAHSPDNDHLHGVTKILKETRYTISSTWSLNQKYNVYAQQMEAIKNCILRLQMA